MAHAPQFFTLPETEDKATVDRVRALAEQNGRKLAALGVHPFLPFTARSHLERERKG